MKVSEEGSGRPFAFLVANPTKKRAPVRYTCLRMDTPKPVDLIIDARYIVPIEPAGTLIDHALVVDDGRIVALAPSASIERDYVAQTRVALPTHLLIPGLVNAHTHAAMVLLRGIALSSGPGTLGAVFAAISGVSFSER